MKPGVRVQWVQGERVRTPIEKILSLDPGLPLSLNPVAPGSLDNSQGGFECCAGGINPLFIGSRVCWACQGGAPSRLHPDVTSPSSIFLCSTSLFVWPSYLQCPDFLLMTPVSSRMSLFNLTYLTFAKFLFQNKIRFTDTSGCRWVYLFRGLQPRDIGLL